MRAAPSDQNPHRGFTLPELLVVVAISAILMALAVPSFSHQRAKAAVQAAVDQTMAALQLARRLALARGQSVTACPSADGERCGFGDAHWILFANNASGSVARREPGETLLQTWTLPPGVAVTGTRGYAAFQPQPGAAATLTLDFCAAAWPGYHRSIVVSQTGRARISRPNPDNSTAARCP